MPLAPHVTSPQPTSVIRCSCSRQFHASSGSPCADNAMLHVCAVCVSALFPRAFSDAKRSLLIPHANAAYTCRGVNAPQGKPQPKWDRIQWINAPIFFGRQL